MDRRGSSSRAAALDSPSTPKVRWRAQPSTMTLSLERQNAYRAQYRAQHPGWRPATEVYEALIRERLRPGMRVVDIGCGRGGVLENLNDTGYIHIGVDPDTIKPDKNQLP